MYCFWIVCVVLPRVTLVVQGTGIILQMEFTRIIWVKYNISSYEI